ncbi:MAG: hypothetical protein JO249_19310 [Acidobacteria bacterium]|nr:hypothetical protein [Acidobacteriota bacterium]
MASGVAWGVPVTVMAGVVVRLGVPQVTTGVTETAVVSVVVAEKPGS